MMAKTIRIKITLSANPSINLIDQIVDDDVDTESYIRQVRISIKTHDWIDIVANNQTVSYRCSEIAAFETTVVNE